MRGAKVFDIDANEDSQLVATSLQVWAAHGIDDGSRRSHPELVIIAIKHQIENDNDL